MSVNETKIASCDACKKSKEFTSYGLPSGWEKITLRQRNGDGSWLHFLDLCPDCQEKALKALKRPKK